MPKQLRVLLLLFCPFISTVASAQCDCTELLKYGLYNHFASTSQVANYASVSSTLTQQYNEQKKRSTDANATYNLMGASLKEDQAKMVNRLLQSDNFSEREGSELISTTSSVISPEMVSAYKECLRLCSNSSLTFKADIPNDLLARSLGFTMTYKRPDFTGRVPKVKDIVISPAGCYTCRGSIVDLKIDSARVRPSLTYAMTCERKIFTTPQKLLGTNNTYVRASEALIKIETDMGVYSVRIPPIYSNPELNANVGEIIASMLSPEQFTQAYGLGWVLADGRAVPENSRYKSFVGPSVPDLRGVFLRGRNYNRDPNTGNPDNDKEPGAYQADELKSHDHGYALYNDKIPRTGGSVYDIWRNDKPARTTATGGLETRPRNVTVNYYIKID